MTRIEATPKYKVLATTFFEADTPEQGDRERSIAEDVDAVRELRRIVDELSDVDEAIEFSTT